MSKELEVESVSVEQDLQKVEEKNKSNALLAKCQGWYLMLS
jgi:hypothetical protein